jgi:hypothetical protein
MSVRFRSGNPGFFAAACAVLLSAAAGTATAQEMVQAVGGQVRGQMLPSAPTGTATVTVTVVAAEDGAAVKGARLTLLTTGTAEPTSSAARPGSQVQPVVIRDRAAAPIVKQARTNASGVATFSDLPGGDYVLVVQSPPGYVSREAPRVRVADGSQAKATVTLSRGGVLTGRVFDEDGDPVTGAYISIYRVSRLGGRPQQTGYSGLQPTNDLGVYRVWGLPAGEYLVATAYDDRQSRPSEATPGDGYLPTYYPSVAAIDQARPVQVKSGQETGGADIQLVRGRLGSVHVRVFDSGGNAPGAPGSNAPGISLTPRGSNATQSPVRTISSDGGYLISGVPPGDYYLSVVLTRGSGPGAQREGACVPVTVSGDEASVSVQTNQGATVSGRVIVDGTPPAQAGSPGSGGRPTPIRVSVAQASSGSAMAMAVGSPATVRSDGSFTLTGIRGPVHLLASGGRAALESVSRGSEDLTGRQLDLLGTERLDDVIITMTYGTGTLQGQVLVDGEQPSSAVSVLVVPDDPEKWTPGSPFTRWLRATSGASAAGSGPRTPGVTATGQPAGPEPGSFQLDSLVPGRYLVLAFADSTSQSSAVDPQAIERLREFGRVVRVETAQTATVKVEAIK